MNAMGDKISSKQMAISANVPIIPGVDHAVKTVEEASKVAEMVGYPIRLKASNGGGGTRYAYRQLRGRSAQGI